MNWIIIKSNDGCEWELCLHENLVKNPKLMRDTEGEPMLLVLAFEVETYNKAREVFEKTMLQDD